MGSPAKVLIIEDDPDTIGILQEVLREAGFAAEGCTHERLPEANGFGLVITDLALRGQVYSSAIASEWVRLVGRRYQAPVVVVTGHSEASTDDVIRAEAADVIAKPIDLDDLQRRVAAAFVAPVH